MCLKTRALLILINFSKLLRKYHSLFNPTPTIDGSSSIHSLNLSFGMHFINAKKSHVSNIKIDGTPDCYRLLINIRLVKYSYSVQKSATRAVLSFEDENFFGHEADTYDWSTHPCRRACDDCTKPMQCPYVFVVETYTSMSKACYDCPFNVTDCYRPHCLPADGSTKDLYVVNRQFPGPSIEVTLMWNFRIHY